MKNKFFSRLSALALSLCMLLPCVLTAPVHAAGDAVQLFHWRADKGIKVLMEEIQDNLKFEEVSRTSTHLLRQLSIPNGDGTATKRQAYFLNTTVQNNLGLPSEEQGLARRRHRESLRLTFNEFPSTQTKDYDAVNVRLTYAHTQANSETPVFAIDAFDVQVQVDGVWLEDSVSIRSWKLLGHSTDERDATNIFLFDIQTENLFDIDGFDPGDTLTNIRIRPHGEYYYSYGWFGVADVTINGYKTSDNWQAAVPAGRTTTYVGEEKMRDIVLENANKIAETPWTSDTTFYSSWAALIGAPASGVTYPKDLPYRGPVYTREFKSGYELWSESIVDGKYTGGYSSGSGWGMDCTVYAFDCYSLVSRSHSWILWQAQSDPKLKLLGDITTNADDASDGDVGVACTDLDIIQYNDEQTLYEAYALLKPGDVTNTYTSNSRIHVRLAIAHPNVVRKDDGTIDGEASTITITELGNGLHHYFQTPDGSIVKYSKTSAMDVDAFLSENPGYKFLYVTSIQSDWEYTFASMYDTGYVPYTLAEYETGMVEDLNFQSVLLPKEDDITKGFSATVATNYHICKFTIQLLDTATGEVLYSDSQTGNPNNNNQRPHQMYYDWHYDTPELDAVLGQLTNGSYRIAVSVLAGPVTEIRANRPTTTHYYDFTITDKTPATTIRVDVPASAAKGQTIIVPVTVSSAYAAADVEIKFDSDKLSFVSGAVTPAGLVKDVQVDKGIARITLVDADATAGQLAQLTFTAKQTISDLAKLFAVKSAQLSTQDGANIDVIIKGTGSTHSCASINLTDVAPSTWYHDAVDYVLANNILAGYNATTFGPNDTLNRAMVVQMLYNTEGQPSITGSHKFRDVSTGHQSSNAITWAKLNKIVDGYGDGRFGPNDKVTLEQVVVMLWNYSGNPTPTGDASSLGAHSSWATNALSWAAANGMFENVPYNILTDTATRAQTAQILMNYLSK